MTRPDDAAEIATGSIPAGVGAANGNSGPAPTSSGRHASATSTAVTTGTKLRGFHSNSSSSTASMIEANGVPKMPVMPAAAPATSSVLRSAALKWNSCANSEPIAPPVMMIGPFGAERAAAADRDRRRQRLQQRDLQRQLAVAEQDRLDRLGDAVAADLVRPEARHQPDDQAAEQPGSAAPAAGRDRRSGPAAKDDLPYQKRLVAKAISFSSTHALNAPPVPATIAIAARISIR